MARNDYRGDPRSSARSRRAAFSARLGPQVTSGSIQTVANAVTVDANNFLELGYTTGELIPVAANQTILGIMTVIEGDGGVVGGWRKLQFGAGCILVYDSVNFILPGLSSIVTVDGDAGTFYCTGGTANAEGQWVCTQFLRGGVPPNPGNGAIISFDMTTILGGGVEGTDYVYTSAGFGGPGDTVTIPLTAADPNPLINGVQYMSHYAGLGVGTPLFFNIGDFTTGVYTYTSGDGLSTPFVWTRATQLSSPSQFVGSVVIVATAGAVDYQGLWFYASSVPPVFSSPNTISFLPALPLSPVFVAPVLGTPASGNLVNCSGYPALGLAGTALPATIVSSSLTSLGTISGTLIVNTVNAEILIATASLTLGGGPTSTPHAGFCQYDTTQNNFCFGGGVAGAAINQWMVGSLFALKSSNTITASGAASLISGGGTAGTGVGTMTIPAGMAGVGTMLRLRLRGAISTASSPGTATINITVGGTTVCTSSSQVLVASLSGQYWELEVDLVFRAVGSSGVVYALGKFLYQPEVVVAGDVVIWKLPPTGASIDTTGSLLIDATWNCSVSTDTITTYTASLERLM